MSRARLRFPWKHVALHHIDGNPRNNDLVNLRVVDVRDGGPVKDDQEREIREWMRVHGGEEDQD